MTAVRVFRSFSTRSDKASENGHLYDMDVVIEDLTTLLKTRKGEYPMQPNIGIVAYDYIYQPRLNDADKQDIIGDIEEQLGNDPRVSSVSAFIEEVDASFYYLIVNATILPMDEEITLEIRLEE